MSSTEQAPEPTMDEILASIRKIIADDDEAPAEQQDTAAAPAESAAAGEPNLADDIASALSQPAEAAQPEEDILDLTSEVPNAPPPAEEAAAPQPAMGEPPAQPEMPQAEAVAEPPVSDALAGDPVAAAAMPPASGAEPQSDVLTGQPMQETGLPEQAMGFDAAAPQAAPVDAEFPETSEEIDAMGSTPPPEAAAEPEAVFAPEPEMPAGEEMPSADEPVAASLDTGTFAPEAEAHETEAEATGADDVLDAAAAIAMPESSAETAGDADFGEAVVEPEDVGEAAASGEKSLEDSVKEMLKPMLREWLDENLPRIVEGEVKKEAGS